MCIRDRYIGRMANEDRLSGDCSLIPTSYLAHAKELFVGRRGARLARRASCRKRGRDGTTYSRFHPSNYLSHHLAGIVTAAVFSDAAHIVEEIALLKTRTSGATRAAAAADPIE